MYEMGDGVSKDGAKATQYSKLGALAGCETSSIKLGLLDANAGRFD
jgi:TPR repeat protein